MNDHMHSDHGFSGVDRRDLLRGGLLLGLAGLVGGCASRAANLPGHQWPGSRPAPEPPRTASLPQPAPVRPAPGGYFALPPGVIPRSRWTNQGVMLSRLTANGQSGRMGTIARITLHHDALEATGIRTEGDAAHRMALVRNGHVNRRPEGFADIGYHFVVDPAGRVWEGRPLMYQGAHVKGQNEQNIGIMLMGHFDRHRPTAAQVQTMESFVADLMRRYSVPVSRVRTHQEMASTECPGRNLQRHLVASRSRGGAIARA